MRSRPELVSVVIAAYNSRATIGEQLESLTRQDYAGPFEVIVADNRSTDGTAEIARRFAERLDLRVIEATDGQGAGPARNAGVAEAKGELLAFVDDDDVATPSWLREIIDVAVEFDLVGGPYECERLSSPISLEWRSPSPMDRLPTTGASMGYAYGGNFSIWRDVFDELGGFYPLASEDNEICWRAQLAGWTMGFAQRAVVYHRSKSTIRQLARKQYRQAIAHCYLYRRFRNHGLVRKPVWRAVVEVGWALIRTPWAVVDAGRRGKWVARMAHFWGCVVGNLKYGVIYF